METPRPAISRPGFALPAGLAAAQFAEGAMSLRAQLVQSLREAIFSGALKPGERLSDAQLCEDYGVSRTSIREALRYLESEKLITVLRNRRAAVARLTARETATIYELLALVLGDAAAILAGSITPRQAAQLTQVLVALEEAHRHAPGTLSPHLAHWHGHILRAAGDTVLQEIGTSLLARIGYLQSCALKAPGWPDEAMAATRALAAALSTRTAEAARQAARAYFMAESRIVTNVLAG
jgi:DNA-binding GntR family transcriptional regulator